MTAHRSRERGSQMIELALTLPLLLLLGLLVAEGAQVVRVHQVLNNAAREGARLSSLHQNQPGSCDSACQGQIVQSVVDYATANGIDSPALATGNVTLIQSCQIPTAGGAQIPCTAGMACGAASCFSASQVSIAYTYQLTYLQKVPGVSIGPTVALNTSATFRNLSY